jgi:putative flippase GtrA
VSSAVNFAVNRRLVFRHGREKPAAQTGVGYFSLVLVLLAANFGLIAAFEAVSLSPLAAKILAEIALLAVSYVVQQRFLFAKSAGKAAGKTADERAENTHIPA